MNPIQTISPEELNLLKKADTPTICNVIELFDVRPHNTGYMDHRIMACFHEMPPMVGYATTATFRSASPPREGGDYAGLDGQLDALGQIPEPRVVVFQDLDNPPAAATFGELMCGTYKSFGCAGLITSGTGRDLQQVRALQFPVFTSGTICAHGYCHIIEANVPVHVGGITVNPGDLLHGDCNGITTIPNSIAGQVARLCAGFMEAENHHLDFIRSGSRDRKKLAEARAACRKKTEELRQLALQSKRA
ncbi:MAG: RraA family protein [Verrucomicrobia bacterium]|nr:RraA family protein [Verrucomicrobiota bacterium]